MGHWTARPGWQDAEPAGRPHVRFRAVEVLHLGACVIVLTAAFALAMNPATGWPDRLLVAPVDLVAAFVAVSSGFVLHELGHKIVAQHYGHWAEFRAQFRGLLLTMVIAVGLGFLVAAPGAVWIRGRVTPRENGIISLVGPGINLAIAAIAYPFAWTINPDDTLPTIMHAVALVNALLAGFNLLPVGVLDGRKVWRWSKVAWGVAMAASIAAVVLFVVQPNGF